MDSEKSRTPGHQSGEVFRCARCGVESRERTCFILPGQYSAAQYRQFVPWAVRCITCHQKRRAPYILRALFPLFASLLWPLWRAVGLLPADAELGVPTLIFAFLLFPLAVVAHELGHAVTAIIVGLEVGGVDIGFGRVRLKFQIRGLPIRLHSWPISGVVFLGASSERLLRTRVWVATLMGPMTNAALAYATAIWWKPLSSLFGSSVLYLWCTTNLVLAAVSICPRLIRVGAQRCPSDGLALLAIPRTTREKMKIYLGGALLIRALFRYENGDFTNARLLAKRALTRTPKNAGLLLIEAKCDLSAGDYQAAVDTLEALLPNPVFKKPRLRAQLQGHLAFALGMLNISSHPKNSSLQEADRLSREAFETYPCVLEYRCSRALVLAAMGSPELSLRILDYLHFRTGTPRQRSQYQATRGFVFRTLNRARDAEEAAALALELDAAIRPILQSLGFSAEPTARMSRQALSRSTST